MHPGESSHPGGSEYVLQEGGRGYFRPRHGRPKFTLFYKKTVVIAMSKKTYTVAIFKISRWGINYDKPLIHYRTDILKIVAVLVLLDN